MAIGGWFDGDLYYSGNLLSPSDAQLKDDVEPLAGALDMLLQLAPKAFTYRVDQFPTLNLSGGQHFGFIAQELEAVLPDLVKSMAQPAPRDEAGNELSPAVAFKAVGTSELLPWVVAAIQEQQALMQDQEARIAAQEERLQQMEGLLSSCCNGLPGDDRAAGPVVLIRGASERLLDIIPNPVADVARINFTLERGGHVVSVR